MENSNSRELSNWRMELVNRQTEHAPSPVFGDALIGGFDSKMRGSTALLIWRILNRRKWGFLAFSFLGIALGIATALFQTPKYQASAAMEIEDLNEDFLSIKQVTPIQEGGAIDALTDIQTKVKALQSEGLLRRAYARTVNHSDEIDAWRPMLTGWRRFERSSSRDKAWAQLPMETLERSVKVRVVPMTKDIEVLVVASNPRFAAVLVNEICNEFVHESIEARTNVSRQTGEWLEGLVKETRAKLERSEAELQDYANGAGLHFDSDRKDISEERLRQAQQELSTARADRQAKQALFELANRSAEDGLPEILDDRTLTEYATRLTDLKRQAADLAIVYTPDYTKLKRLRAEISSLESAMRAESASVVQRVRNEYWAAARRESLLDADYQNQSRLVAQDAEKAIQYNVLRREVDGNRQAYDALLQRAQEATIAVGMRTGNIRLLDPAIPPRLPFKPSLFLNGGVGLFLGMMLGAVWVFVRESTDSAIRYPGDSARVLDLPELGVIPHGMLTRPRLAASSSILTGPLDRPALTSNLNGRNSRDAALRAAIMGDSFRGVLTSLLFLMREREGARVFALTSASPAEGKTTITANLGLALAEVSSRVLIIDGDVSRGRLSEIFGFLEKPGLVDLLEADPDSEVLDFIHPTRTAGLSILNSGRSIPALSALLHSNRFPKILAQLRAIFDVIVIDAPPVLATPDARILGRASDGVILVTRAKRTLWQAALVASRRLVADGSVLVGTILNDCDPRETTEYYPGYGYGQRYRAERKQREISLIG